MNRSREAERGTVVDDVAFDRLTRSLAAADTRRDALARLVALVAAAGMAPVAPGSATAGRRHRRRLRHRRRHDNRKGQRNGKSKDGHRKPRRDDPPFADCTKPGARGQPCARTESGYTLRCCDGACPAAPACVSAGRWTSVSCQSNQDCRAANQCCTLEFFCDDEEGLCFCGSSDPGDPCGFDHDCDAGACVCGHCQ
jgi:hypothetical protein